MELATVQIKLSGQPHNTVYKHNVTPAQLAIYAYMHGEDCVASLKITGVAKNRDTHVEMDRLRQVFISEHGQQCMNKLFPGIAPHLPVTFRSIGYDSALLAEDPAPVYTQPQPKNSSEAAITQKIKEASAQRQAEAAQSNPAFVPPVDPSELTDALDDTGGALDEEDDGDDNSLELSDDPLDAEIQRNQQTENLPPAAPPQE